MTSIKHQLFSGVFYTALAKYSGIGVSLVVAGVLARLISPDDFGVMAIATVIIAFFNLFTDVGLSPAIIQHKGLTRENLSGLFSFTIWTGIGLALLFAAASWPIAAYYDREILRTLCQLLAVNLFFASATIVPNALFYRNKEFKFIALRSFVIQIATGAAAVVAALCGAGLYALVIGPILSGILIFVVSIRRYPQRLRLTLGLDVLRRIFSYSAYQFLFNIINYFSRNLDKLLIGKYMGMSPLGYYEKSYRLMMLPLQNIAYVVSPVMHPIFSEMQNDLRKLADSYRKVVRLLALIGLPLSVVLWFTAQELVLIIFGDQWQPSVPVFRILALSVGIQIVMSTSGSIFQAANATRMLFFCGLFSAALNTAAICTGIFAFGTTQAVAWCICISFAINFIQCYHALFCLTLRTGWGAFWRSFLSPLLLSALVCLPLAAVEWLLPPMPMLVSLAAKGAAALAVWLLYIQFSGEYDLKGTALRLISRKNR